MPKEQNEQENEILTRAAFKLLRADFFKFLAVVFISGGFYFGTTYKIDAAQTELKALRAEKEQLRAEVAMMQRQFTEISIKLGSIKENQDKLLQAFRLTPVASNDTRRRQDVQLQ